MKFKKKVEFTIRRILEIMVFIIGIILLFSTTISIYNLNTFMLIHIACYNISMITILYSYNKLTYDMPKASKIIQKRRFWPW